jgi:hypothetical protein
MTDTYFPAPAKGCIEHYSTQHPSSDDYEFCYTKRLFGKSNPTPCRWVRLYFRESDR